MNQANPVPAVDEDDLAASIDRAIAEINNPPATPAAAAPAPAPRPAQRPTIVRSADDDVARFLGTTERMITLIRQQMSEAETNYTIRRATLGDEFRRRMADLENEAREALRRFDTDYSTEKAKRQRMLDALLAMREV